MDENFDRRYSLQDVNNIPSNLLRKIFQKDFALIYILASAAMVFILMVAFYEHPEFGFAAPEYGLGVVLTVVFPLVWALIYGFCKVIARKNEVIAGLKEARQNPEAESEVKIGEKGEVPE